ncbi:uncharacterized protein LOC112568304 isoform X1 [Pomacea canaliculata]|uniref:uncharacterized protein LOC112568304 isoform X1 n=1 Tax=Pomacea canaliculata TaxID=400727 RepID=UPI000D72F592|nr:uncharacterized protein LOC112568304 isoform X1 [Pomacea canaliculata]
MTTTHQLMAAAFYLCGLLFLLHVDSVNSLKCRNCTETDTGCNSGNVPEIECELNDFCYTIKLSSPAEPDQVFTLRGCTAKEESNHCVEFAETWKECHVSCSTDNCNSANSLDE